jgi:hypothetical protein
VSHSEYVEKIFPQAEKIREKAQQRANHKKDKNRTYKNQSRVSKTFELGQIVAHCPLQLATGPNMSMRPKFDGPYTIVSFDEDGVSARLENLDTGDQMRAHFTNMMPINFHPSANRAQTNFDDNLADISPMLRDRYTIKSKSRCNLNIDLDDDDLNHVNARFSTKTDNPFTRICLTKSSGLTSMNTVSSTNRIIKPADSSTTTSMTCKKTSGNKSKKQEKMDYTTTIPCHHLPATCQTTVSRKMNFSQKQKEILRPRDHPKCSDDQTTTCPKVNLNMNQHQTNPQTQWPMTRTTNQNMNGIQIRDLCNRTTTFLTCPLIRLKNQTPTEHTVKSPI